MKYTMVKQFSNGVIDNIFSFVFKWVDCGKMFLEFLWSFLEIWIAFFLIFYNAGMYVYYLFLFFIDRGAESGAGYFRVRGAYRGASSSMPRFELTRGPSAIPPQYGGQAAAAVSRIAEKAAPAFTAGRSSAPAGVKKPVLKEFGESLIDLFKSILKGLAFPFKKLVLLFDRGAEARKVRMAETDENKGKGKSLIDEYLKEYEQKRR